MCKNEGSVPFEEVVCEDEIFEGKSVIVYTDDDGNDFVQ